MVKQLYIYICYKIIQFLFLFWQGVLPKRVWLEFASTILGMTSRLTTRIEEKKFEKNPLRYVLNFDSKNGKFVLIF
jgi:hypothetical protein